MPTLSDVARLAGVSIGTVSRVLNQGKDAQRISENCAQRVRVAAVQLGYTANYHATTMRKGCAYTIGVTMERNVEPLQKNKPEADSSLTAPYFMHILAGLEAATASQGYMLSLVVPDSANTATRRTANAIRQRRFDAAVSIHAIPESHLDRHLFTPDDMLPMVVIQPDQQTIQPSIEFDEPAACRLIIEHLCSLGHHDLLWVCPTEHDWHFSGAKRREQLFATTAMEAGRRGSFLRLPPEPDATFNRRIHWLLNESEAQMTRYLATSHKPFTAVVCHNDMIAVGVGRALLRAGKRIPHDVSIIGFDNTESLIAWPPMTSLDHCFNQMGQTAGQMALDMIQQTPEQRRELRHRRVLVQPALVVRESTGPAPQ